MGFIDNFKQKGDNFRKKYEALQKGVEAFRENAQNFSEKKESKLDNWAGSIERMLDKLDENFEQEASRFEEKMEKMALKAEERMNEKALRAEERRQNKSTEANEHHRNLESEDTVTFQERKGGVDYSPSTHTPVELLHLRLSEIEDIHQRRLQELENARNKYKNTDDFEYAQDTLLEEIATSKMSMIALLPLPANEDEMLELLFTIKPLAQRNGSENGVDRNGQEDLRLAYWQLFAKCIEYSRVKFSNPQLNVFYDYYEKEMNKKWWQRIF